MDVDVDVDLAPEYCNRPYPAAKARQTAAKDDKGRPRLATEIRAWSGSGSGSGAGAWVKRC